jgi:hypothetical protein
MKYICFALAVTATVFLSALPGSGSEKRTGDGHRDALIALENEWLKNEHNAAELEHILAADFLHPVMTGDILNKPQHIKFSSTHIPEPDLTKHFEGLRVRIYGDVGIVNGWVVTTGKDGNTARKSVFTDVFLYKQGRWQAINAQENAVQSSQR